jgi:NTP pyrophosphatase (non-canonical NTP hydrolase)
MIDIDAARELKKAVIEGFDKNGMRAAEALLLSIEDEYGPLNDDDGSMEVILGHEQDGHTPHCARRMVWGDGECECSPVPTTLAEWSTVIHQYAMDKGWWEAPIDISSKFMLFTSEVAEAYEEYRNGRELAETYYEEGKPTKPEGVPTELADVIIRILDFTQWAGIDIQAVMAEKHRFNLTRPYRHGGKRV